MLAFGLSKKLCNDFLKKQAIIGNLNEGRFHVNVDESLSQYQFMNLNENKNQ